MLNLTIGRADDLMNGYNFIASIIGSLAWPVAAVVISVVFRYQIAGLLKRIKEFSWGDKKITLDADVAKIEARMDVAEQTVDTPAEDAAPKPAADTVTVTGTATGTSEVIGEGVDARAYDFSQSLLSDELFRIISLVSVSPNDAVLDAFRMVEKEIDKIAAKHGLQTDGRHSSETSAANQLKAMGVFNVQMMVLLADLRKVRNQAAHARDQVDPPGALRYIVLVSRFLKLIADL